MYGLDQKDIDAASRITLAVALASCIAWLACWGWMSTRSTDAPRQNQLTYKTYRQG